MTLQFLKQHSETLLIHLSIVLMYLYFFPYFDQLNNPSENARMYMTKAIVEHKTFALNSVFSQEFQTNADLSYYKGKYYSSKSPGASLLGVPFYFIAHQIAPLSKKMATLLMRFFVSVLPSLLFLFFFYRFLAYFTEDRYLRNIVYIGFALGTMFFTYGLLIYGHQQAAISLFSGFMLLYSSRRQERDAAPRLFFSGLLIAFAVVCEAQTLFMAFIVFTYGLLSLKKKWKVIFCLLGGVLPALLLFYYNYACYDSIFKTGTHFLANKVFAGIHTQGVWGFLCFSWEALLGVFVSPANGLFFYSPWLIFLLPGLVFLFFKKQFILEALCLVLLIVSHFFFMTTYCYWKGGWSVGPRFLTVTLPFLVLPILIFLEAARKRFQYLYYVFVPLVFLSILFYSLASPIFPHFPDSLENPFFELLVPLIGQGYYPYNIGRLLGLNDFASAIPYYIVLISLIGYLVIGYKDGQGVSPAFKSRYLNYFIISFLTLVLLSLMSLPHTKAKREVIENLRNTKAIWEPPKRRF